MKRPCNYLQKTIWCATIAWIAIAIGICADARAEDVTGLQNQITLVEAALEQFNAESSNLQAFQVLIQNRLVVVQARGNSANQQLMILRSQLALALIREAEAKRQAKETEKAAEPEKKRKTKKFRD